jgi:hypothetical protein
VRSFGVTPFVLSILVLGLCTFSYVTLSFQTYNGGELLLFRGGAVVALRNAVGGKQNTGSLLYNFICISCTTLFRETYRRYRFRCSVGAISLLSLINQRRLTSSIIAMWVASAIGALCFLMFWRARGPYPGGGSGFSFHWFPIWFSVAGATFSGISGFDFSLRLLGDPSVGFPTDVPSSRTTYSPTCSAHSGFY